MKLNLITLAYHTPGLPKPWAAYCPDVPGVGESIGMTAKEALEAIGRRLTELWMNDPYAIPENPRLLAAAITTLCITPPDGAYERAWQRYAEFLEWQDAQDADRRSRVMGPGGWRRA